MGGGYDEGCPDGCWGLVCNERERKVRSLSMGSGIVRAVCRAKVHVAKCHFLGILLYHTVLLRSLVELLETGVEWEPGTFFLTAQA